jgi:YD repeat-containing protein
LFFYAVKNGNQTGIVDSILFLKQKDEKYFVLMLPLKYNYDANGNIIRVYENDIQRVRYYYDGLNRLVRADNNYIDKTITYCYDKCGEKGDARRPQDRSNKNI